MFVFEHGIIIAQRYYKDEHIRWGVHNRAIPYRYDFSYEGKSLGEGTFGKVRLGIHMPTN
jgi:hypothetical protein